MPGLMQAWPTVAACWSPAMPRPVPARPGRQRLRRAAIAEQSTTFGQHRCRHAEELQQIGVPIALLDVEQHGAARHWWHRSHGPCRRSAATAGSIRWCRTASSPVSARAARPPRDRGSRRSWWRRNRDRAAGRSWLVTSSSWPRCRSSSQTVGGAAILPDDGVVDRLAGGAVPHHDGLALVGDADAGQRPGVELRAGQRAATDLDRCRPDFLGIVLDPAGLGKDLRQLLLRRGDGLARGVEDDGAGAGGALVDGEDVRCSHRAFCRISVSAIDREVDHVEEGALNGVSGNSASASRAILP